MDVLRAVLGDEELSYLGYSYRSERGGMYAEAFPQNLRAMVIDGAVDPERTEAEFRQSQFAAWQKAFDALAVSCAADADCPLGIDPARATETFQDLLRPLQDTPYPEFCIDRNKTHEVRVFAHLDALHGRASRRDTARPQPGPGPQKGKN
jgi:pimeloyl-ACP methyl ester carboxylesterase